MFHELAEDPADRNPEELYAVFEAELVAAIEEAGIETVAESGGVDEAVIEALLNGEAPELELEEASAILAAVNPESAEEIAHLSRDALLMGMTNAVLDVESLSAAVDGKLEPREIQSKVEGRYPMTLREFALLHGRIQSRLR